MTGEPTIGGTIELRPKFFSHSSPSGDLAAQFGLTDYPHVLTASGRSAFAAILDALGLHGGSIVLPDYLCTEALYPVLARRGLRPQPFFVGEGLRQQPEGVLEAVARTSDVRAVLLVAYFGLAEPTEAGQALTAEYPALPVILDSVQDLAGLSSVARRAEWAPWQFYSLMKALPLPDGGLAFGPGLTQPPEQPEAKPYAAQGLLAALLRGLFLNGSIHAATAAAWEAAFLRLTADAGAALPFDSAPISGLSRLLLEHINIAEALVQRQINYVFLRERLHLVRGLRPLIDAPVGDAVPLALPVVVEGGRRDRLRAALRARRIFCPVHWPLSGPALAQAGPVARARTADILSLPLDQRYNPVLLGRMVDALAEFDG